MRLASRGRRDLDGGAEPIEDAAERVQVRRQARTVVLRSAALALVLTLIAMIIPAGAGP